MIWIYILLATYPVAAIYLLTRKRSSTTSVRYGRVESVVESPFSMLIKTPLAKIRACPTGAIKLGSMLYVESFTDQAGVRRSLAVIPEFEQAFLILNIEV